MPLQPPSSAQYAAPLPYLQVCYWSQPSTLASLQSAIGHMQRLPMPLVALLLQIIQARNAHSPRFVQSNTLLTLESINKVCMIAT